jgi:3-oxoacyl-[acyl-carrier protein] reductase
MKALTGKVAIVTGASKGIGASIATALGTEGASVVVNYASSREGADRVLGRIADAGGNAIAVQANVSEPLDVQRLFAETKKAFGKLTCWSTTLGSSRLSRSKQSVSRSSTANSRPTCLGRS